MFERVTIVAAAARGLSGNEGPGGARPSVLPPVEGTDPEWDRLVRGSTVRDHRRQRGDRRGEERPGMRPAAGIYGGSGRDGSAIAGRNPPMGPAGRSVLASYPQIEILAELGRGGMGVVYKARHHGLSRNVALKMITEGRHTDPMQQARLRIEAQAIGQLEHPNIVQIYEVGDADGCPFVLLELLEGGTLADRLKEALPTGRAAAELVATLATAIHAAHRAGIVHRDLKPSNILFDTVGNPKVADFGLAKRLDVDEGQTPSGQVMGTPSYMAPEQAMGSTDQIGPSVDVYALGAILYEMLTGRPPFKGSDLMETLRQVLFEEVVPPSRLQPKLARDLVTICLKCLEKTPQKRYASAEELAEDLRRYLGNRPIRARRSSLWEHGVKWARRHPAIATLLGLGLVATVAAAAASVRYDSLRKAEVRREADRVAGRRADSEKTLFQAQVCLAEKKWTNGRLILTNLMTALKSDPRFSDIHRRAASQLALVERGHQLDEARREDQERVRLFHQRRNEAFFHETHFTGLDLPTNLQTTRAAARWRSLCSPLTVRARRWR